MKKIVFILLSIISINLVMLAQSTNGKTGSVTSMPKNSSIPNTEDFEEIKTKVEVIIPKDQHIVDETANVKIEYMPLYDEARIYYECMYVTYNRGEAMNTVLQCLEDFKADHKYYSYKYIKDDKERFFKDDKGRRKTQYISTVKFSR
ncbi:MAG: hypothetical protein K6E97_07040 [Treponema sp.]|nr:hypothetical protein [Treponema sp.]